MSARHEGDVDTEAAVQLLISRVRARPWGLAVAAVSGDSVSISFDAGADPVGEENSFEWGSITKTMTGVLLAYAIVAGELRPEQTLGELLGVTGSAGGVTLQQLATQRSGLPRLPPNLDLSSVDPLQPYSGYTSEDLHAGLCAVDVGTSEYGYSNFGFMTLGRVLSVSADMPYPDLLQSRLLEPLGLSATGCPPPEDNRMPGYAGEHQVPWWSSRHLPGAGGVGGPIGDLVLYLQAHLDPPEGSLGKAITLATALHAPAPNAIGYGWVHQGGGLWHNGGTGGFHSFVALHQPSGMAVALLANSAQADLIDRVGFATLTEMITDAG